MPKTRRHKINRKRPAAGQHIKLYVSAPGEIVKAGRDGSPHYEGRSYTGVNRGKTYPYASVKRGGKAPEPHEGFGLAMRNVVGVIANGARQLAGAAGLPTTKPQP